MKFVQEYRDPVVARKLLDEIASATKRHWVIMEICGGQTHAIMKNGIDRLLPDKIELVHGPGCPVCVTPLEMIDKALAIAAMPGVIFTSFGDMLRVPGSSKNLLMVRSEGADVRIVYSPLEALNIARQNPEKQVVFFGVGFETTAPITAMTVWEASRRKLDNFCMLVSHVLVPPAIKTLLGSPANRIQGFLAAGHVCAVMGWSEYEPLAQSYRMPITVTGFEPVDILEGILMTVHQLEQGRSQVENQYSRAVKREGNLHAQEQIRRVMHVVDRKWRGIGTIPASGLALRQEFEQFNAESIFDVGDIEAEEPPECISGIILQGLKKPFECPAFGTRCTPQTPLGATMVSSEGTCAAYYAYSRHQGRTA